MPNDKNGNKIYVVLVICVGLVVSIWLLERNPVNKNLESEIKTVSVNPYINIEKNDDWKKILTTIDNGATDTTLISKNNKSTQTEEDSTLTDQMSRDFLSQYLLAVKNNGGTTPNDALMIAKNTLLLPDYTESVGAKYISANLKITSKADPDTLRLYRNKLYKIIVDRTGKVKDDPIMIVVNSLSTEDEGGLAKLDYIILQNKGFLNDLLGMEVPKNIVELHLSLLNASSKLLANLESMRQTLFDPVRGLAGIGEYSQTILDINLSLDNFSKYFIQNL